MIGTIRQRNGEKSYFLDGVAVTREMYDSYFPSKLFPEEAKYTKEEIEIFVKLHDEAEVDPELKARLPRGYPIKSVAMATTTKGIAKYREECVRRGVPTDFTPGGRPILTDAAHYKRFRRAFGVHFNNAYDD